MPTFICRLPDEINQKFLDYLQKYSYGENTSEKFRIFITELLRLESEGITLANPRSQQQRLDAARFQAKYGEVKDAALICVKGLNLENQDPAICCTHCQVATKDIFKACQSLRAEFSLEIERQKTK